MTLTPGALDEGVSLGVRKRGMDVIEAAVRYGTRRRREALCFAPNEIRSLSKSKVCFEPSSTAPRTESTLS